MFKPQQGIPPPQSPHVHTLPTSLRNKTQLTDNGEMRRGSSPLPGHPRAHCGLEGTARNQGVSGADTPKSRAAAGRVLPTATPLKNVLAVFWSVTRDALGSYSDPDMG